MNLEQFKDHAKATWDVDTGELNVGFIRTILGCIEELGEIAGKFKKCYRKDYGEKTRNELLLYELGDILYYVTMYSHYRKLDLVSIDLSDDSKIKRKLGLHQLDPTVHKEPLLCYILQLLGDINEMITSRSSDAKQLYLENIIYDIKEISNIAGYAISYVAKCNIEKLAARKNKGTIKGSGDNR